MGSAQYKIITMTYSTQHTRAIKDQKLIATSIQQQSETFIVLYTKTTHITELPTQDFKLVTFTASMFLVILPLPIRKGHVLE